MAANPRTTDTGAFALVAFIIFAFLRDWRATVISDSTVGEQLCTAQLTGLPPEA